MSQQINLYSPIFRKQKKLFTAAAMAQAMALVLVLLAALYGYAYYRVVGLEREAGAFDRRLKAALAQLKDAGVTPPAAGGEKALEAQLAELEARIQANETLLAQGAGRSPGAYSEPLRALARQRLEGVWLTSIGLEGDSGELSLGGRALHAGLLPRYIERLGRDPAMRGRQFSTLRVERTSKPAAGSGEIDFQLLATEAGGG